MHCLKILYIEKDNEYHSANLQKKQNTHTHYYTDEPQKHMLSERREMQKGHFDVSTKRPKRQICRDRKWICGCGDWTWEQGVTVNGYKDIFRVMEVFWN